MHLLPLMLAAAMQQGPIEPGWTELFNGKDFTGWNVGGNQDTFKSSMARSSPTARLRTHSTTARSWLP